MSVITINSVPYIGCEDVYFYQIGADSQAAYSIKENTDIYKVPELVAVSLNMGTTDTNFYANNVKKITDTTYNITGSITLSGDDEKLEQVVFGKTLEGGALKDNLSSAPEVGMFYGLTKAKGAWVVRQILKATCSKADSSIDTKGENTNFQTSVMNVNPLFSEHFGCYVREFYSSDAAFASMTMKDVLAALAENPSATFPVPTPPASEEPIS